MWLNHCNLLPLLRSLNSHWSKTKQAQESLLLFSSSTVFMFSEINPVRRQEMHTFKAANPRAAGEMFHSGSFATNFTEPREKSVKTVPIPPSARSINCLQCGISFPDHFSFNGHMFNVHGKMFPLQCQVCGKAYQTSTGLSLHMEMHSGKSYVCPICDKKFTQKGTIKLHLRKVHKMSQCQTCMTVFRVGDEFNQHVLHCRWWPTS